MRLLSMKRKVLRCTIMRELIGFIKNIGSFYRFWRDYEFTGDDTAYIVEQYQSVLSNRTRCLSKPTYTASNVICAIDEWYEKTYEEDKKEDNSVESFEIELNKFCEGCGHFNADVTTVDVTTMEDMFNNDKKYRTYIKCANSNACERINRRNAKYQR